MLIARKNACQARIGQNNALKTCCIFVVSVIACCYGQRGFQELSLCPYTFSATDFTTYTSSEMTQIIPSEVTTWASYARPGNNTCPANLTIHSSAGGSQPTEQTLIVADLAMAENNTSPSGVYVISIFRAAIVNQAYVELSVTDSMGKTIVPLQKVALTQPTSGRRFIKAGTVVGRRLLKGSTGSSSSGKSSSVGTSSSRSGGFNSASTGGRSYGYSGAAAGSRYPGGYSRTGYGYSGRGAVLGGAVMFMWWPRQRGGHYRDKCSRYSGSSQSNCENHYKSCTTDATETQDICSSTSTSALTRDDLMLTGFEPKNAKFPLKIKMHKTVAVFPPTSATFTPPEEWDQPMFVGLSEVDFDDEEETKSKGVGMLFLIVLGCIFAVCLLCCMVYFCKKSSSGSVACELQQYPNDTQIRIAYPPPPPPPPKHADAIPYPPVHSQFQKDTELPMSKG